MEPSIEYTRPRQSARLDHTSTKRPPVSARTALPPRSITCCARAACRGLAVTPEKASLPPHCNASDKHAIGCGERRHCRAGARLCRITCSSSCGRCVTCVSVSHCSGSDAGSKSCDRNCDSMAAREMASLGEREGGNPPVVRDHHCRAHVRMHQKSRQRAQDLVAVVENALRGAFCVRAADDPVQ